MNQRKDKNNFRKNKEDKFTKEFSILSPPLIKFIIKLVRWLGTSVLRFGSKETTYALLVTDKILTIWDTRGKTACIKYCKDLRLVFLNHILSMNKEFEPGVQSNFPKFFKPIIDEIGQTKSYPFIRLILSVIYLSRYIRLEPIPSFKTITTRPGYAGDPSDLRGEMYQFLKELGVNTNQLGKVPSALRFKQYHMTSKSGPNGHALWTSFLDYLALNEKQKQSLKIVGGEKLFDLGSRFSSLYLRIPQFFNAYSSRQGTSTTRRLTVIQDKEGKSREVAIMDYWTQASLKPLHDFLFKQLSRISQDCTKNQTKWFKLLRNVDGNSFHSVDLTAATDRFPIDIQKELLSLWFGEEYASHWKYLMVGEPFLYKEEMITYQTGNPMGAYSSWATFAICHHFFVYLACKKARVNWKKCRYMLLGDDIVIAHDGVAKEYKNLLLQWDVPYSDNKTHTSLHGFEFAKQVRLHGNNISPFPLSALIDRRAESFTGLSIICSEVWTKDWNVALTPILKDYYIDVLGWARPKWKNLEPKINLVVSLLSFLQGRSSLGIAVKQYVSDWAGKDLATLKNADFDLYGKFLALKIVHQTFLDSIARISNKNDTRPLGQLAEDMVIAITSLRDGGVDCFDLIEATPFLQIYGRAEETYLALRKDCSIYQVGESPKMFRESFGKVDIPLADEAFYVRHRDVLLNQALRTANMMIEMIKTVPKLDEPRIGVNIQFPWAVKIRDPKLLEFPEV